MSLYKSSMHWSYNGGSQTGEENFPQPPLKYKYDFAALCLSHSYILLVLLVEVFKTKVEGGRGGWKGPNDLPNRRVRLVSMVRMVAKIDQYRCLRCKMLNKVE